MNIINTFLSSRKYYFSTPEKKLEIQQQRLKKLVSYSKKHSKALAELYQNVGDNFTLQDLPITNKQMIMDNYDRWVTDPKIKLDELKTFIADTGNVGKRFLNKYLPVTTSGSTGFPFVYLMGRENQYSNSVESMIAKQISDRPVVVLAPKNRFLIPTCTIMDNLRKYPFLDKMGMKHVDASLPMDEIVDQLAEIRPRTLFATASTIHVLADICVKRGLKLKIDQIVCGSELLTPQCRAYLEEVFGGTARNIYGCTEGGNIAYECDERHLHLHNSWTIVEPVDENYNAVPYGTQSNKVLLTNLSSYTLPIIRYEVTDRIIVHNEPCSCGNPNSWIEISGRTSSDPLIFNRDGDDIPLSPMPVYYLLETLDTMRRFQMVLHNKDCFECRVVFMPGVDQKAAFEQLKTIVTEYLHKNGVYGVDFYLSDILPQIDPKTLKFKSVYQVFDE